MKFRFPIVIVDEDFHSENASGLADRDGELWTCALCTPCLRQGVTRDDEAAPARSGGDAGAAADERGNDLILHEPYRLK